MSGASPATWASRSSSPSPGYEIRDDHLALNNIARIPTIDIIDFEYPTARGPNYWHTTAGRARKLLGPLAGQSRLGRADMAGTGSVSNRIYGTRGISFTLT